MRYAFLFSLCWMYWLPNSVLGQQQQVIQQPTIGTFSVNTSVLVPDQGSTLLGSNRSSVIGRNQQGVWPLGSGRGSRLSAGGASASVTVIDLQEMDRAILQSTAGPNRYGHAPGSTPTPLARIKVKGMSEADLEDVDYFLTNAQMARRQGRFIGMDVYIQLAKAKIPADQQSKLLAQYGFVVQEEAKLGRTTK